MTSAQRDEYISTNIRILSVNDIYTTSPLPLASSNILEGAISSINLPPDLLDPTPKDAHGRPNPRAGTDVPVVLPIGGLDILRSVFDELSTGTTIEGNQVTPMNTLSFLNGDILGGSLFAEHFRGESMTELLNEINPTIIGIGNHEYDYGTPQFERLMGESKFTWLGENMTVRDENIDSDGKVHQSRPHINVPPCTIIDFIVREDDDNNYNDDDDDETCNPKSQPKQPLQPGQSNATVVGRYRNVILELLIANMLRGRCDIHDYTRFLKASAENYEHIKETVPTNLESDEDRSNSTSPCDQTSPACRSPSLKKKKQQFYLYRVGIFSVCTQFTPNLSFPSPNTKFEKPEIYALLLSLLLKTIGCHSLFLVSHLSLAGDMKIAQLSRKFTRMLQAHNTVYAPQLVPEVIPNNPPLVQPHLPNSITGGYQPGQDNNSNSPYDLNIDQNTVHSRYTLIDTIFGGHEHEPIIMQLTEFESSGVVVDESGGDSAKNAPHPKDAPQDPYVLHDVHSDDEHEIAPPTLEYIASLRAPHSGYIQRENIQYNPYDGPAVIKAGMNNQYTAVVDYTIFIPKHSCINHPDAQLSIADRSIQPFSQDENGCSAPSSPEPLDAEHVHFYGTSNTTLDLELNIDNPSNNTLNHSRPDLTHQVSLRDKFNSSVVFNDPEYFITLHKDISITFNIIKHLILTTLLAQNSLKKTTPVDFLEDIFRPFKDTPIYMTYLQDILGQLKRQNTIPSHLSTLGQSTATNTLLPSSTPITPNPNIPVMTTFELPISPAPTPAPSIITNPVSPASIAPTTFSQQLLPQDQFTDFSSIHSSLILPQYKDVLSRIHNPKRYQDLLQLYNTVSCDEFKTHLQSLPNTTSLSSFDTNSSSLSSLNLNPEDTEAKTLRPLHIIAPGLELNPSSSQSIPNNPSTRSLPSLTASNSSSKATPASNNSQRVDAEYGTNTNTTSSDDAQQLFNAQAYLKTALTNGIMPVPTPHQTDFALSPLHYINHYHDVNVAQLQHQNNEDRDGSDHKGSKAVANPPTPTLHADSSSNPTRPLATFSVPKILSPPDELTLQRLNPLSTDTNESIIHHPFFVYTKLRMFMIPNIQLPDFFPPQIRKLCSNIVQYDPSKKTTPIPSHICRINFPTHQPSHKIVSKWSALLQEDIAQGRDLEQIVCVLDGSFDTRSAYGRTQGGVSGPNAVADAMHWHGQRTAQSILAYQQELHEFVRNQYNSNDNLDVIDAADIPAPPDGCPIEWSDLTDILLPLKHKIKGVISCINGGFLRGDKYYAKGSNLTLGDFLSELPFPKTALHALIFGKDLIRTVNQQLTLLPTATGAFPHWSDNVSIDYTQSPLTENSPLRPLAGCADGNDTFQLGHRRYEDPTNPFFVRGGNTNSNSNAGSDNAQLAHTPNAPDVPKRVINFLIDGEPIDPNGLYFITSTQFILWGGDGLTSTLRSRLIPHIDPDKRWKVIGELALEYFAYLKAQANAENDAYFVFHYAPTKRVTMHRKEL